MGSDVNRNSFVNGFTQQYRSPPELDENYVAPVLT